MSWARHGAGLAVLLLLCAELTAARELWLHGDYFANTAYPKVRRILADLPPGQTAVVHEGGPVYFALYFPIQYEEGPALAQYVHGTDLFGGNGVVPGSPEDMARLTGYQWLVVVNAREQKATDLARQVRHGDEPVAAGKMLQALESSGKWRRVQHELGVAFIAADIVVLERSSADHER